MIRSGDWRPGATSPALLLVQLLTTSQAALRGLDYLVDGAHDRGPVAAVEAAASPTVWGALFAGSALAVLVGLAGRWAAVLVVAHLLLGAVYVGLGVTVLNVTSGGLLSVLLGSALVCAVGGSYLVACPEVTSTALRFAAGIPLLVTAAVGVSTALGDDYRAGSGFVVGGLIQVALAYGVAVASTRTALARFVDREVDREEELCPA